jgi:hypothetical protein
MKKNLSRSDSAFSSITAAVPSLPWLMLFSRSALFLLFQGLIALILLVAGKNATWDEAGRWWTSMATLANIGSFFLLVGLFKSEGRRFLDILRFSKITWKKDLLWFIGFTILAMPLAALPREPLARAIFGDAMIATDLLFRPLPMWGFLLAFLFPLTIAFAELPTYFGYCMPRLEKILKNGWVAWIVASIFLAAQHMFLPLIFNGGYLLWRFAMFLPFALITGLALKLRPQLLPYLAIGHGLIDITTVLVYLMIPGGVI